MSGLDLSQFYETFFDEADRAACDRDPGIVQTRNVWMFQRGEGVALLPQAFRDTSRPAEDRQLDCHLPLQCAVSALRQPNGAHATPAEFAQQLVWADVVTGLVTHSSGLDCLRPQRSNGAVHKGIGFDRVLGQHGT